MGPPGGVGRAGRRVPRLRRARRLGAGPDCDGQVLVFHDLLGLEDRIAPKFVRRYASLKADGVAAVAAYADDVRARRFPADAESYHLGDEVAAALGLDPGSSASRTA